MKLLLENWRQYLAESERLEKAKAEYKERFGDSRTQQVDSDRIDPTRESVRFIKQLFNKYSDKSFLNSLTLVHWDNNPELYLTTSGKDQTSAAAYLPEDKEIIFPHPSGAGNAAGIVLKGHIVFASQEDIGTSIDPTHGDFLREANKPQSPESRASSGFVKGSMYAQISKTIFDRETFGEGGENFKWNEFIVDNWEPIAIIVPGGYKQRKFEKISRVAKENNLPLLDENKNKLNYEISDESKWSYLKRKTGMSENETPT